MGCIGPNQNRLSLLARDANVRHVIYAYTKFHPNQLLLDSISQVAIPKENITEFIKSIVLKHEINIIYSLLNAHDESTEVTIELLDSGIEIPIVRHYKEHPCFPTVEEKRVLTETAGQIYINRESFEYFRSVYGVNESTAHILDADMISACYMTDNLQGKLSAVDGRPHLLVAGSISVLNDRLDVRELCVEMNRRNVCVHLYGNMVGEDSEGSQTFNDKDATLAYQELTETLNTITLHSYIKPETFAFEWSKYDAGFMHAPVPASHPTAQFEEINMPYRYTAYICAGLPICVPKFGQSAMKKFIEENNLGFAYDSYEELSELLHKQEVLQLYLEGVIQRRKEFSFEFSIPKLVEILSKYSL